MATVVEMDNLNSPAKETDVDEGGSYKGYFPIYHDSAFRHYWDGMIACMLLYIAILMPFLFAFYEEQPPAFDTIDLIMDCLFIIDIPLNFFTTFATPDGRVIHDIGLITKNYMRFWFYIDFISSIPLGRLMQSKAANLGKAVKVLRIFKFAKMMRMSKLAKMIPQIQNKYEIKNSTLAVVRFTTIIFATAHWLACFFFLLGRNSITNWVCKYHGDCPDPGGTPPVAGTSPYMDQVASNYLTSMYWAFTTMTTIGYGDITPNNDEERGFMLFAMCLGAGIFAYGLTNMCTLVFNFNQREVLFTALQDGIKNYLDTSNTQAAIVKKIRQFIFYRYTRSYVALFQDHHLLEELSPSLRNAVLIDFYNHVKLRVPLLEGVQFSDGHGDLYVSQIVPHLQGAAYPDGELIIKAGQVTNNMYFVAQGKVEVQIDTKTMKDEVVQTMYQGVPSYCQAGPPRAKALSAAEEGGRQRGMTWAEQLDEIYGDSTVYDPEVKRFIVAGGLGRYGTGGSFNEVACAFSRPSTITAFARTYVDVYSLSRDNLFEVLDLFPELEDVKKAIFFALQSRQRTTKRDFTLAIDGNTLEEREQCIADRQKMDGLTDNSVQMIDEETGGNTEEEADGPRVWRSASLEGISTNFAQSGVFSQLDDDDPMAQDEEKAEPEESREAELERKVDKLQKDIATLMGLFEQLSKE